jgi:hypothetical protein
VRDGVPQLTAYAAWQSFNNVPSLVLQASLSPEERHHIGLALALVVATHNKEPKRAAA